MKEKIVLSEKEIKRTCKRLGSEITKTLTENKTNRLPILIGVMKGSLNFMMDLMKFIKTPILTDYIELSSYNGTKSSGEIIIKKDVTYNLEKRDVVIVEDVVDTGVTMRFLVKHLEKFNVGHIYICTLFNKTSLRKVDVVADFIGKELKENYFLMGYGFDFDQLGRNCPYVYSASKECIDNFNLFLENDKI